VREGLDAFGVLDEFVGSLAVHCLSIDQVLCSSEVYDPVVNFSSLSIKTICFVCLFVLPVGQTPPRRRKARLGRERGQVGTDQVGNEQMVRAAKSNSTANSLRISLSETNR
jgi:hypothetical protein